jgi:hypothetical protein
MSTSVKKIEIKKILEVEVLALRATARRLLNEEVRNSSYTKFKLDFRGIEFASRSFMDELNALLKENSVCTFKKINMNEQIQQMDHLVLRTTKSQFVHSTKRNSSHSRFVNI